MEISCLTGTPVSLLNDDRTPYIRSLFAERLIPICPFIELVHVVHGPIRSGWRDSSLDIAFAIWRVTEHRRRIAERNLNRPVLVVEGQQAVKAAHHVAVRIVRVGC